MFAYAFKHIFPSEIFTTLNFLLALFQTFQQLVPAFWQSWNVARVCMKVLVSVGCAHCRLLGCQAAAVLILNLRVWFAIFHIV